MEFPELLEKCLSYYEGYLVGSAAEMYYIAGDTVNIKDYDIIIPPFWFNAFLQEANNYEFRKLKRLGGIALISEGIHYDIWSMDLGEYYHRLPKTYSGYVMNFNMEFFKRL